MRMRRGSATDIWALGCVLELCIIATVAHMIKDLDDQLNDGGNGGNAPA